MHSQSLTMKPSDRARLLALVEKTDSCWVWLGFIDKRGYGTFKVNDKTVRAHRASYAIFCGDLVPGLTINHKCSNRKCVNPDHIEQVTMAENNLAAATASTINKSKTHCIRGHAFDAKNTYLKPDGRGRECRTCKRENWRAFWTKKNSKL